jgi:hypothetical protein
MHFAKLFTLPSVRNYFSLYFDKKKKNLTGLHMIISAKFKYNDLFIRKFINFGMSFMYSKFILSWHELQQNLTISNVTPDITEIQSGISQIKQCIYTNELSIIQDIHKRMVRFQWWIKGNRTILLCIPVYFLYAFCVKKIQKIVQTVANEAKTAYNR